MAEQLSLFDDAPAGAPRPVRAEAPATFASVVVDVSARALSEPFAYAVPAALSGEVLVGATVLVGFAGRKVAGYVVALDRGLACLPGTDGLDPARVKPIDQVLAPPSFSAAAARVAFWMSREYVASPAECLRLFLPPGGSPKPVRQPDGTYRVERPQVARATTRWVSLTDEGRAFVPAARAHRQRQLLDALSCGPVTTQELGLLHPGMSGTVRALERRGAVRVEERRVWRGGAGETALSSATAAPPKRLTRGQRDALDAIEDELERRRGGAVLVDGVTGSGKTEVYLSAIEHAVAQGGSACVLVPEISLTAQTVGRFRSRFGDAVAVFHSRLTPGERLDQWDRVALGEARVVVGARSALFCPYRDLRIIIIDEEHEQSYKQGTSPRYHAREVALAIGRETGAPVVMGSATPSAEAFERARAGTYLGRPWRRVEMPERPGEARLPRVVVADLRREFAAGSRSIFSVPLAEALLDVARRREKAVVLHNRRGFAPFLMCRECGCVPTCDHCSTALTYHERTHTLECHTCGTVIPVAAYPAPASRCPRCGSRYLAKMGLGTQQVEDALRALLPDDVAVIRMDADSTRGKDGHRHLLEEFDAAECAVLLGTQMIAKGLDFPEVTLAAVINADYALKMPDFRAGERSFDLLEQLAGRAGRGERPGTVIIQTYLPDDPVIRAVATHDRAIFTEHDRAMRAEASYPPFVRLVNVVVRGADERAAERHAASIARALRELVRAGDAGAVPPRAPLTPQDAALPSIADLPWDGSAGPAPARSDTGFSADVAGAPSVPPTNRDASMVEVLGPAPCVIKRAKDRYRFHVLVKSPVGYHISEIVSRALRQAGTAAGISISVDVDAYDLM